MNYKRVTSIQRDHSGFCEGIDEDYLEEVKEKAK
jgi:hypothetical protein